MRWLFALAFAAWCCDAQTADKYSNARPPRDDEELRFWLENMIWHHRFTTEEVRSHGRSNDWRLIRAIVRHSRTPERCACFRIPEDDTRASAFWTAR